MSPLDSDTSTDDVISAVEDVRKADVSTVRDIIDALGAASFLPLMLIIALAIVTPLSGVPGVSSVSGIMIALIAGQLLFGCDRLWLPDIILRRAVPSDWVNSAVDRIKRPLLWINDRTKQRLTLLARGPAAKALLVICMICGLAMPFLEVLPATSSMLAGAISILCIAIISRDGLLTIAGLISLAMALTVLSFLIGGVVSLL